MDDRAAEEAGHSCLWCACVYAHRVGHNEIIGVMRVGCHAEGLGRDHWNEMLAYPRKPIAHWHPLLESKKSEKEVRFICVFLLEGGGGAGGGVGGGDAQPCPGVCLPQWKARTASFDSQGSCPSPRPPASP